MEDPGCSPYFQQILSPDSSSSHDWRVAEKKSAGFDWQWENQHFSGVNQRTQWKTFSKKQTVNVYQRVWSRGDSPKSGNIWYFNIWYPLKKKPSLGCIHPGSCASQEFLRLLWKPWGNTRCMYVCVYIYILDIYKHNIWVSRCLDV